MTGAPARSRPHPDPGPSLALSLKGLVLVAILPLLVFGSGAAWIIVAQKRSALEAELHSTARAIRTGVDRELEAQLGAMEILATDAGLDRGDRVGFSERIRLVARKGWLGVALIDPASHAVVEAANVPPASVATTGVAFAEVDEVARTGRPRIVGMREAGPLPQRPFIQLLAPVVRAGRPRYVLAVALDPAGLESNFERPYFDHARFGGIVDNHGVIAGRSWDAPRFVGKPVAAGLAAGLGAGDDALFEFSTLEGGPLYAVASRSRQTGWAVVMGTPAGPFDAAIRNTVLSLAAAGAALIACALAATAVFGRRILERRNAYESALRESRERVGDAARELRELIDRIPIGIYKVRTTRDAAPAFEFVSRRWCDQHGVTAAEVYRDFRSVSRHFHPDDLPGWRQANAQALVARQAFSHEARVLLPSGTAWLRLESRPTLLADGEIVWNGMSYDITERHNSESSLRASEEKLRGLFELSPIGIVLIDAEGRGVECNEAFRRICGHPTDEPASIDLRALIPPGHGDGRYGAREIEYIRPDGQAVWVQSSGAPIRDAEGRTLVWTIVEDITERRRSAAELELHRRRLEELVRQRTAALAARERQFEVILNGIPGMVGHWDAERINRFANHAYLEGLGIGPKPIEGRHIRDVFGEHAYVENEALIDAVLRGERQDFERPYRYRGPGGGLRHQRVHYIPDREGERILGFFVMAFDIEDLLAAREQAQAANVAKSTFIASMSHEIRTPLNAVIGLAELLARSGLTSLQSERLDKIRQAGRHLLELINAVLDFAQIEAGKLVLEQAPLEVEAIVENVVSMLGERAQAKAIRFEIEAAALPPDLLGDATKLQQALLNFVGNAVKFTHGGTVTLRTCLLEESAADTLLRFEVQDTGIGISEAAIGRLFNAFEQADHQTARGYGGSGLGLAISRKLAQVMGGEAGVRSTPGVGSLFWFTARLAKGRAAPPSSSLPPAQVPAETDESAVRRLYRGFEVLLADDEPINQEITVSLLEDAGLVVDVAADGVQALQLVGRKRYDLILMDVQMPNMDGLAATRAIRALAAGARVPILAMTANVFAADRARSAAAGMNDFIGKPIQPPHLFGVILRWLAVAARYRAEP